jgi:uncharacterized protein involved in exopolysaccharide biosynthesis
VNKEYPVLVEHVNDPMEDPPAATGRSVSEMTEVSFLEIATALLRNWRMLFVIALSTGVVATAAKLFQERMYSASTTLLVVGTSRSSAGGAASSLAQQFGISLGMPSDAGSIQLFADLARSRPVLRAVLEQEYELPDRGTGPWRGTLLEHYQQDAGVRDTAHALHVLRSSIKSVISRETNMLKVSLAARDPVLAEQVLARLLNELDAINVRLQQARASDESSFVEARLLEAHGGLLSAENTLMDFMRSNREFQNSPTLFLEYNRLQRDVSMRQEVVTSLLRNLEQTRIDAARDTRSFSIIDPPVGTAEPVSRGTIRFVLLAIILGLVIGSAWVFINEYGRSRKRAADPHYREFEANLGELWRDVRRPSRWFRRNRTSDGSHVAASSRGASAEHVRVAPE